MRGALPRAGDGARLPLAALSASEPQAALQRARWVLDTLAGRAGEALRDFDAAG